MTPSPDCSFVICVEKGSLEYKALLLLLTLRKNWGCWANLPVYAYSPRKGMEPSGWLKAIYERYGVTPVYENLNEEFFCYPLANKPLAMAHAEQTLKSHTLVFLDTDILCWNPPTNFYLPNNVLLSMSVDGTKTVASSGPGDPYDPMWNRLYRLADIMHAPPYVRTQLTGDIVKSWWISSVIVCNRDAGVMAQWRNIFERIYDEECIHNDAKYLREQIAIDVIATKIFDNFHPLPVSHNYPIQNYRHHTLKDLAPESAVLWHYQPFLNRFFRRFASRVDAVPSTEEKISIAQASIKNLQYNYQSLLGRDEPLLREWRRRLRLGPRVRHALGISKSTDK